LRDQEEAHVRVLIAAELRTASWIDARPLDRELVRRRPPRDQVFLPVHVRDPEAVDDVGGRELQSHGPADRNVDLVRSDDRVARRIRGIAELPPPLMPDDLDLEVAPPRRSDGVASRADARREDDAEDD